MSSDNLIAARFAWRELRSGLGGFWIFLACVFLGVASIAIIGTLARSIERGMAEQGQPLLGGDVEFAQAHTQLTGQQLALLKSYGQVSAIATVRAMAETGSARALIEIKAVDQLYPLFGALTLTGGKALHSAIGADTEQGGKVWQAVAEPSLLTKLGLAPGGRLSVGKARFVVRATIAHEPDRIASGFVLGPRLMMTRAALKATGIVQPGSLVTWRYRVKLDRPDALQRLRGDAKRKFPQAGWRIKTRNRAAPGVQRFIDRLSLFLTLAGLTALIVGGVGVANGVTTYLAARRRTIAMLKCLGATGSIIFRTWLFEVLAVAALAIAAGVAAGAVAPLIAAKSVSALLPVPLSLSLEAAPLAIAAAFGLLTVLGFVLWPLSTGCRVPAASLFRGDISPVRQRPPVLIMAAMAIIFAAIAGLALISFPHARVTGFYLAGLAMAFVLLTGFSRLIMLAARRMARPPVALVRYVLANIHRPGTPAPAIILSLGLGLSVFVALALIDFNISRQLRSALPDKAPSFFFIGVDNRQKDRFMAFLKQQPGTSRLQSAPMLRGRIISIKGVGVARLKPDPEVAWVIRGDRGLAYAETLPDGASLTAGKWWPRDYDGPNLVSFTADAAHGLGISVGDKITVNVLGRDISAKVANLRAVDWGSLRINFVMVFSPGTLKNAPHSHIVTAKVDKDRRDGLVKAVTKAFPAISAISVSDAIAAVSKLIGNLLAAVRAANLITLLSGVFVLAGAIASGLSRRIYDAVVLKTYGASRGRLMGALVMEFAGLGLAAGLFGVAAGSLGAWAVITQIMEMDWAFSLNTALFTAFGTMAVTVLAGLATTWRALTARPARVLRRLAD